ncbi:MULTISPECIES: hypothetical protein [Ralstonia]|jgi:hypothetical protein|uniref:Carboxypeptidase regulatory-like domain-containing protein n=1 Tax=Ralstonia flaminis TaxID=3058597 RepID=A0ABM9K7Q3_9RALS|nr:MULTISPECIES: hypothetical protein [unclassified Ralstonia]CAJ0818039.1 hypothetical protein LMG18101_03473 [Ralstonia sp. LMG 18101]
MNWATLFLPRCCLTALLLASQAVIAAEPGIGATPEVRFQNEIAYISGGIGRDERDAMHAMAGRFNVRLNVVSARNGEALSDIDVSVVDEHGKPRLHLLMPGPLLYMKLPHGRYQLTAAYGRAVRTVLLRAGAQPVDMVVSLPAETEQEEWLLCKRGCAQRGARAPSGR